MWTRAVAGSVLCIVGVVWIGQGAGAIHGSFMTGESVWAFLGALAFIVGLLLLLAANRARHGPPPER